MRNRAKCKNCGDVIESKHRRDWVACSCFRDEEGNRGFYLDGGGGNPDFFGAGGNFDDIEWIIDDTVTEQIQRTY